ncbi:hypothetical protein PABG_00721 [Paracoccidioides brasiliensis Pb03]|nr:hypothetical protein PABG_00721 [Paracoccidioides brasiliensis Pb03]
MGGVMVFSLGAFGVVSLILYLVKNDDIWVSDLNSTPFMELPIEAYSQPSSQLLLTGDQDSASYRGFYDVSEPSTSTNDPIIGFSHLPTYHLVQKRSAGSSIQLSIWKFGYV